MKNTKTNLSTSTTDKTLGMSLTTSKRKRRNGHEIGVSVFRRSSKQLIRRTDIEQMIIKGDITAQALGNFIVGEWGLPIHPILCPVQIFTYGDRIVAFHTADYTEEQFLQNQKITVKSFTGENCVLTAEQFGTILGMSIVGDIIHHREITDANHELVQLHQNSFRKHMEYRATSTAYNRFQD